MTFHYGYSPWSHAVSPGSGRWISTQQFLRDIYWLAKRLPASLDAIVGMSRTGMYPASLLASHMHLPLYAADEQHVIAMGGGWRSRELPERLDTVLLIDDTSCTGRSMAETLPHVRAAFPAACVVTAVIYATPETAHRLDYVSQVLPNPHYLEWNFFNSGFIAGTAFDMDGILCEECSARDDDDGPRYRHFLQTAAPRHLPRRITIPVIISARLEKYRDLTLGWLRRYRISVGELVLGPWATMSERNQRGIVVHWKAEQYRSRSVQLFVESDPDQAEEIAKLSGKPVLCPDAEEVFKP